MTSTPDLDIFLVSVPGLEAALFDEVKSLKFRSPKLVPGGVEIRGRWPEVWRANLEVRGTSRVLARFASFRALHLAQLDKRARKVEWATLLNKDVAVRVEASCKGSKIYHSGAVAQRITRAISEEFGAPIAEDAPVVIKARLDDDLCTLSVDTSGEMLHKRGHKQAVAKAPLRETMAAMFLRLCGYTGEEPVLDPMCGSGTFVIEAAEIAMGLMPGRNRPFAFEQLATFKPESWEKLKADCTPRETPHRFYGRDRDAGAIKSSAANAERAGVSAVTEFRQQPVSDLTPPEGPEGLVIVNPPYGTRIGDKKPLFDLYAALGQVLLARFGGWRVGLVTADKALAKATGLPFRPTGKPVSHGGLPVHLFTTEHLPKPAG